MKTSYKRVTVVFIIVLALVTFSVILYVLTNVLRSIVLFEITIIFLFFTILYALIGYPIVLKIMYRFLQKPHMVDDKYEPTVTLLIAAYNEANVLAEKLSNSLQLDYPQNKLRLLVVSDGSTDGTDMIAEKFKENGVELLSLAPNRGKMTALNEGFKTINSEIVVLSDANVMYDSYSIRKLVRHFVDPSIGAVSGKVTLINDHLSYADAEVKYYDVEHSIQQLEGDTGSMIGADGAMYALRTELYRQLPEDTILDDFVISMGVVKQGRRLIHEPEAVAYERNIVEMGGEFRRKVRIIAGGLQTLIRRQIFPKNNDMVSWFKLISHKILRWMIGPIVLLMAILIILHALMSPPLSGTVTVIICVISVIFLLGCIARFIPVFRRLKCFILPYYLLVMFVASLVGCWRGLLGSQSVTWKQVQT